MISLRNIELRLGAKLILQEANTVINPGEKVSIVGKNGVGKTTFFSLLRGEIREDQGELELPRSLRISHIEQVLVESDDGATDFVLQGDSNLMQARAALQRASQEGDGVAIGQAYCDLIDAGEHTAIPRAQALIQGLGFKSDDLNKPVISFSGGWRMRLQLARALMCPSDLLLLDEPTNHLDLDALVWLESWLKKYEGTLLVISHDREFLDAVTNVTVHMEALKLTRYNGNYSAFEELRLAKRESQQALFLKNQEKIAHVQKYIDRFRYKATKAKQAQSRIKALERFERISAVVSESDLNFGFRQPKSLPNPMLVLDGINLGYENTRDHREHIILKGISKTVLRGQRIGVLGANGQGKSTLVKTIARQLRPLTGSIVEGKGLAIGYFAQQELDILNVDETPFRHMFELEKTLRGDDQACSSEQELRRFLGSFNISGDMIEQRVGTLSGGEKARLVLCMIAWQRPNLLLLDEPTNHLDLSIRDSLTMALNQFEGSVILVSHDRALLRNVCDEFWLVAQGEVVDFEGDVDDYQSYLMTASKSTVEKQMA